MNNKVLIYLIGMFTCYAGSSFGSDLQSVYLESDIVALVKESEHKVYFHNESTCGSVVFGKVIQGIKGVSSGDTISLGVFGEEHINSERSFIFIKNKRATNNQPNNICETLIDKYRIEKIGVGYFDSLPLFYSLKTKSRTEPIYGIPVPEEDIFYSVNIPGTIKYPEALNLPGLTELGNEKYKTKSKWVSELYLIEYLSSLK